MPPLDSYRARTRCPICKKTVVAHYMNEHIATLHEARSSKSDTAHDQGTMDQDTVDDGSEQDPLDRADASKNWGYMAREGGMYGSYPMHDDYEDEAAP